VEMKNTAEKDPFQTTDPWEDAVEPNKLLKKPFEESGNTEESQAQMITNEERTDEKKLRMTTKNRFIFAPKPEARSPPLVRHEEGTQKPIEIKDESQTQLENPEEPKEEAPDPFRDKGNVQGNEHSHPVL
jgi:hypothetical protein